MLDPGSRRNVMLKRSAGMVENYMSEFSTSFWSNLLSNIALVVVLSAAGFLAKAKIVKATKKFVREQAKFIIEEKEEKDGETKA